MIWLTWRQFRLPALVGAVALVVFSAWAVHLGLDLRHDHDLILDRCVAGPDCDALLEQFHLTRQNTLLFQAAGLVLALALLGTFWGAPLVARELEAGTHRLVWNQSITRRRWLVTKLALVTGSAVAVTGTAVAVMTWAAAPVDQAGGDRFQVLLFGARNLVPLGYAAFAVSLGAVTGLATRRTLPAMVATFAAFLVVQVLVPNLVRPHLLPPETRTIPVTEDVVNGARSLGSITGAAVLGGLTLADEPDAWISDLGPLLRADGSELDGASFDACFHDAPAAGGTGTFGDIAICLEDLDLHVDVEYQPAGRYWALQLLETGLYLALAGALVAVGLWRIGRV